MSTLQLLQNALQNGGITIDPKQQKEVKPKLGYQVSLPNREVRVSLDLFLEIGSRILPYYQLLALEEKALVGIWISDGFAYFDLSEIIACGASAYEIARARKQLAIWDWENNKEIKIQYRAV